MTEEWKPGDRVQLTGTVTETPNPGYLWFSVLFDGSTIGTGVHLTALAAGKRLPRQFKVGDEVLWMGASYMIVAIDEDVAAIVLSKSSGLARAWVPLDELRPAPVKP